MAQRSTSPWGKLKEGFTYDDRLRRFISTRTGEIVDPATALRVPESARRTFREGEAVGVRYTAASGQKIHNDQAIKILRRQLDQADPSDIVNVRAKGGSRKYPDSWWSASPIAAGELRSFSDDQIKTFLHNMFNDPEEFDIYISPD